MRLGDKGDGVREVQRLLGLPETGVYDGATEDAVESFQEARGLLADGIVGPRTLAALRDDTPVEPATGQEAHVKVLADSHGGGYTHITLRASSAVRLKLVRTELDAVGALLTSAGGIRQLGADVGANRSATSLHYLGRAFDLALYSGMVTPRRDPYVVTADGDRLWRVWARADGGEEMGLDAVVYTGPHPIPVTGRFVDFTAILAKHGFDRISARPAFARRTVTSRQDGAAEWWHFQDETGLVVGETRFGDELLRAWTPARLRGSGPWALRGAVWRGGGFG
jgi:hypothetical protein